MKLKKSKANPRYVIKLGFFTAIGIGAFLVAGLLPEKFWAIHDLWFYDSITIAAFIAIAFGLSFGVYRLELSANERSRSQKLVGLGGSLVLALIATAVCSSFPIVFDDFGNAFQYRTFANTIANGTSDNLTSAFFSFEPSIGRKTVLGFYELISFKYQLSYGTIFKWAGLLSFIVFGICILWLSRQLDKASTRITFVLISLFAPFTLVFSHHYEIYAPVYAAIAVWFVFVELWRSSKNILAVVPIALWTLLCVRIHPLSVVMFIGMVLVGLGKSNKLSGYLSWKNVLLFLFAPVAVGGLVLYFFVVKDFNDPRFLEGVTDSDRLFLPIISPEAPLDRYNLFSLNHILDYFNTILLWSIPSLLVVGFAIFSGIKIKWNAIEVIVPFVMTLMLALVLFPINPLVSMPMDRDLFMFPTIFLLITVVGILKQLENHSSFKYLVPVTIFFAVLQTPRIFVDSDAALLERKLVVTGKHIFKTYYLHSVRVIINGLSLSRDSDAYIREKQNVIDDLRLYAKVGNDPKFANLLYDDAYFYLNVKNDPFQTISKCSEALKYSPNSTEITQLLQEAKNRIRK